MSHLFISYAHGDKAHLDKLVTWLREHEFAEHELWFDKYIEGGNNWRDEITDALDEAFAVLVVVTTNSMKSLYCTFEWAYALGQGIPVLPLIFDDVRAVDMPAPLASKQVINCLDGIPESLDEQVTRLKTVPPQVAAMNKIIYEAIYDTHRRFFILGWAGKGLRSLDGEFAQHVLIYFSKKASEAHQALETLMVDKAYVLSGRQYRLCWQLIDFLKKFSQLEPEYGDSLRDDLFSEFDSVWLPAFEYFEGNGWWGQWIRRYFERSLDDDTQKQIMAEIMRAFPIFLVYDADTLIANKKAEQQNQ